MSKKKQKKKKTTRFPPFSLKAKDLCVQFCSRKEEMIDWVVTELPVTVSHVLRYREPQADTTENLSKSVRRTKDRLFSR